MKNNNKELSYTFKQRINFSKFLFKIIWQVLIGKGEGWVLVNLNPENQLAIINNEPCESEVKISYISVDKLAIKKLFKHYEIEFPDENKTS